MNFFIFLFFLKWFTNGLHNAPKSFQQILKILQILKISHLGAEKMIINIRVPSSLFDNVLYSFSNALQMVLTLLPMDFTPI
jgi:hypothetical protein